MGKAYRFFEVEKLKENFPLEGLGFIQKDNTVKPA